MTVPATVVAVGFGLLLGWGLGARSYPRLPVIAALLLGVVVGVGVLAGSIGPDPSLSGWSLIFGCGTALGTSLLRTRK